MKIRDILAAAALLFLLAFESGCAEMYACKTTIVYRADGSWQYESCKNQENLKADLSLDDKGKLNKLNVSTTATTPEAIIAAVAENQARLMESMKEFIGILKQGAMTGS